MLVFGLVLRFPLSAMAVVILLVVAAPAQADSLHLVFPQTADVTVVQGDSSSFTLEVQALGAAPCSETTGPAVIDSIYSVNAAGQVASGMPAPIPITTVDTRGVSDNCYVQTPIEVPLTATVAPDTPVGDYVSVIHYGKRDGPADLDGPQLTIHVIPPTVITEPVLEPPEQVVLGERIAAHPTLGKTLLLTLVKGNVSFREPGQALRTLGAPMVVRNGTRVDALDGVVKITVVRDLTGVLDSVDAWGGTFSANQSLPKHAKPLTTLTLASGIGGGTSRTNHAAVAARVRNKLWVNGKGNFKTRGKRASAIVMGTFWLTQETSDGTKISVNRGLVSVRDFVKKVNVLVGAGHSYTAKPRAVQSRRIPVFTGSV